VLGGIYRVRRTDAAAIEDPRGLAIDWPGQSIDKLWERLADHRSAVRTRAAEEFAGRDASQVEKFLLGLEATLFDALDEVPPAANQASDKHTTALARTWAISRLEYKTAKRLTRQLLEHPEQAVRHAALQAVSLHRDADAVPQLIAILGEDVAPLRRVAAEALGRIGDRSAVPHLLAAASKAEDRILEHSITYALIELADLEQTERGLRSQEPQVIASALIALDQMTNGKIDAGQVIPHLSSNNRQLRDSALWLVKRHPGWGGELVNWFRQQLANVAPATPEGEHVGDPLEELLVSFSADADIQALLAESLSPDSELRAGRELALRVIGQTTIKASDDAISHALASLIKDGDAALTPGAVAAARALPAPLSDDLQEALSAVAGDPGQSAELRVQALAIMAGSRPTLDGSQWSLLADAVLSEQSVELRSAAAQAISAAHLSLAQLRELTELVKTIYPLELNRVLPAFEASTDEELGLRLVSSLGEATAASSLRFDVLRQALAKYGPSVGPAVDELEASLNIDAADQRKRLDDLLPKMAEGDVRRGHALFYSSKAACSSCHRLGAAGGTIGPELTKVGGIRTERDLLESVLFPSLSFVQSYESTLILTLDGKAVSGRIVEETETEYVLATSADESQRVPKSEVDEIQPSSVSVMPAGFDKQLSEQELADLVVFLKSSK
jgi:putative heme-binding domain-containing protein